MLSKILKTSWAKHTSRCFTKSHAAFQWPADSDLFEGVNRCSSYQLIHSPFSCPFHWTPEALSFVPGRKRLLSFEETQLQQIFIEKALGLGLLKKKKFHSSSNAFVHCRRIPWHAQCRIPPYPPVPDAIIECYGTSAEPAGAVEQLNWVNA